MSGINLAEIEQEAAIQCDSDNLEIYADNHPFRLSLRIKTFESEADFNKFIKKVEMQVRASLEYREWKKYIIDVLGIKTCMITNEKIDEVSIEIHHHLPSLYILVKALVNKRISQQQEFCTFDIATEVIEKHFENIIGYVTIVKTLHEKFHNGFLTIPKEFVKGNFMKFVSEYSEYLDENDLETIDLRLAANQSNCSWGRNEYPSQTGDE